MPEELDEIKAALEAGQNPKESKLLLARTVTSLYHTPEETAAGERFFEEAFTKREIPQEVESLEIVAKQRNLFDCLTPFVESGLVSSRNELRRLISQGGVQKNGVPVTGMEDSVEDGDVLRIGRKKFVKLILVE